MPLPELEPIKFRPPEIVKTFGFLDNIDIEESANNFIHAHPEFEKQLLIKDFAAEQIWFELTPLIVKSSAPTKSMRPELELAKGLGHVAIRPRDAVQRMYYHYEVFVPMPDDMLNLESEEGLLKEHVTLVDETIDNDFRQDLLELKPIGIITRMCGYEGSWVVYSLTIKDDNSEVWSTPLVDAPYKHTQPFIATKGREFVILEDDRDPQNTKKLIDVKERIRERTNGIEGLQLEKQKVIKVNMAWVIAHAISSGAITQRYSFTALEKMFGMHEEELRGPELLKYMAEIVKEPTYRFDIENIRKYTIHPK